MFKSIITSVTLVLAGIASNNLSAQDGAMNLIPVTFKMKGEVSSKGSDIMPGYVAVYKYNQLVEKAEIKRNGKFSMRLEANSHYTLDFEMEGHRAKKVFVNTRLKENQYLDNLFEFDVMLYANNMIAGIDPDFFDYPVAIIEYDNEVEALRVDNEYTDDFQRELKALYTQRMEVVNAGGMDEE